MSRQWTDQPHYPEWINKLPPAEAAFERWWYDEGSKPPAPQDDINNHVYRMARIAWLNGAYKAVADKVRLEAP